MPLHEPPFPHPPKLAHRFFRWYCHPDLLRHIEGDLLEMFHEDVQERNVRQANGRFVYEVIKLFRPSIIRPLGGAKVSNALSMFRQNLLLSFRSFGKYKSTFAINLTGLTTGLACLFLIFLWARDELRTDSFHAKGDRLHQILMVHTLDGDVRVDEHTPAPLVKDFVDRLPSVERGVAVAYPYTQNTLTVGDRSIKSDAMYAGEDFFDMFSFPLAVGDAHTLLSDPAQIVLTMPLAIQLFGSATEAFGQSVVFDNQETYQVAGVLLPTTENSSFDFDFVLGLNLYSQHTNLDLSWGEFVAFSYVLLNEHANGTLLKDQIQQYLAEDEVDTSKLSVIAQGFTDRYLYGAYHQGVQSGGRIAYVWLLGAIGIVILLVAAFNFISLSTAMATRRMREVGMKKVLGARKSTIVAQFLGESTLLALMALVMAVGLVALVLPYFNALADKQLVLSFRPKTVLPFLAITVVTGLFAGIYPAFFISGFKPLLILKNKLPVVSGGQWVRKGLVVSQFGVSVVLILFTLVVYSQFRLIQERQLGFTKDNIIYFDMDGAVVEQRDAFLTELRKVPGVSAASSLFTMNNGFMGQNQVTNAINWAGKDPDQRTLMDYRIVDHGFVEVLELEFTAGRTFVPSKEASYSEIVLNEAAVAVLGLAEPVGSKVEIWGREKEVVGVVRDLHIESIQNPTADPMFFIYLNNYGFGAFNTVMARLDENLEIGATLQDIREFHAEFNPGFPLQIQFLDQDFQRLYEAEKRLAVLTRYFSGLAILISCLGLLGLVAFTAERRTKEIGIRKILGLSEWGIIRLISSDYTRLVLLAVIVAMPLGILLAKQWLSQFAYKVDIAWWLVVVAGAAALVVAWLVASWQTLRIAKMNPATSLRDE